MAERIDSLKNCYSEIEDGTIEVRRKGIIKKIFAKRVVGSFSNNYFSDTETKKLYKVVYEQELGNPETTTYYFDNDTLILVKTLTWDGAPARQGAFIRAILFFAGQPYQTNRKRLSGKACIYTQTRQGNCKNLERPHRAKDKIASLVLVDSI